MLQSARQLHNISEKQTGRRAVFAAPFLNGSENLLLALLVEYGDSALFFIVTYLFCTVHSALEQVDKLIVNSVYLNADFA